MAKADALLPGFKYRIRSGPFTDWVVTILDNTTVPDGQPDARKVLVNTEEGEMYILPRLLEDMPVSTEGAPLAATPAERAAATVEAPSSVPNMTSADMEALLIDPTPITDPMDPRLDKFRPARTRYDRYVQRKMPNGLTDVEFFLRFTGDRYRAENEGRPANLMIKGDTQSGKTFLVDALAIAWADELGLPKPMPVFKLSGSSGVTDYDLFGQPTALGDLIVQMPGLVDLASRAGGILYLDEVNAMGERVTSSLHPVADSTHMFINRSKPVVENGTVMPDVVSTSLDLWIIGTFNEGYRGMSDMNEAFLNRFRHLPWGYDEKVEQRLIKSAAIRLLGEGLRIARDKGHIRTPVGTSALERLEADVAEFGVQIALNIFGGLFKQHERAQVETVIEDRSIIIALNEELKQAEHGED